MCTNIARVKGIILSCDDWSRRIFREMGKSIFHSIIPFLPFVHPLRRVGCRLRRMVIYFRFRCDTFTGKSIFIGNSLRSSISDLLPKINRSIREEGIDDTDMATIRTKINYPEDSLFLSSSSRKKRKKKRPSPRKTEPSVYKRGPLVRIFCERVLQTSSIKLFPLGARLQPPSPRERLRG